ncbi:hypothetical protein [Pseudorhodobacter sp. MZDSW-24AT]|uniref:hypothetical protein n=1 Tax=Pseudorhodobacter sp. MZDSW-24AT TaxID=2052957 RepID=UPI0018E0DDA9|nr:hypothetical protein [Pseudorhodobacter sp. MZDSW-24AT]
MDLFIPQLSEKRLHPSFCIICSDPAYAKVKPIIQNWGAGLLERRGEGKKFLKEFQSTFNSSMWELYLNRAFLDMGCVVDFDKPSPDFFVQGPGNYEFNVEAVVSDDPKQEKQEEPFNHAAFRKRGALKLAGKIRDKLQIFRGSNGKKYPYSSMSHVRDRPFVIAIAPFDNELSLTQNNEIINMVLFGLTPPMLEGPERGRQGKIRSILKPSGAKVEMGIFTNDSHKEISAVFFSTTGTFGKAVVESQIDRIVRSTRYRVIEKSRIGPESQESSIGTERIKSAGLDYLLRQREEGADQIGGADIHIQHSSLHRETHLDGLQVYFNPYAEVPFNKNFPWPTEVALNYFDTETAAHIQAHPDGALVSRQIYAPDPAHLISLLRNYGFV